MMLGVGRSLVWLGAGLAIRRRFGFAGAASSGATRVWLLAERRRRGHVRSAAALGSPWPLVAVVCGPLDRLEAEGVALV
jgi:hypothetical protein